MSVAEITARIGVGEKRMRVLIQDPRTGIRGSPAAFRIRPRRLSRSRSAHLNEALLVATSAMSGMNPGRPGGAGPAGTRPLSWGFRRRRRARPRSRTPGSSPVTARGPGARTARGRTRGPMAGRSSAAWNLRCRMVRTLRSGKRRRTPLAPLPRGEGWPPDQVQDQVRGRGLSDLPAWATSARKIRRNALKCLNPRPEPAGSRQQQPRLEPPPARRLRTRAGSGSATSGRR